MNVQSVRVGLFAICASIMLMLSSSMGASAKDGDRGPTVTITGNPAPPQDVHGELDGEDEDGNIIIIRPGSDVAMTVGATAKGISDQTHKPNQLNELSLWAIKYYPGPPPQIGLYGTFFSDGSPDEAPHTFGSFVSMDGIPVARPSFVDNDGVSHSWIFKWSTGKIPWATTASHTWNLHFYSMPGYYWYSGEAHEVWYEGYDNYEGGGFSFWSPVLGYYKCLD